jgi:hypothetical protein
MSFEKAALNLAWPRFLFPLTLPHIRMLFPAASPGCHIAGANVIRRLKVLLYEEANQDVQSNADLNMSGKQNVHSTDYRYNCGAEP